MDITVEVMLPPRGAADYAESAHPKWRVLSVVDVYYPMKAVDVVGMPRTGYVHVTDAPMPAAWQGWDNEQINQRLSAILTRAWEGVEKREWAALAASIPLAARNNLRINRQITVTWTQFKAALRNMRTSAQLADADLS